MEYFQTNFNSLFPENGFNLGTLCFSLAYATIPGTWSLLAQEALPAIILSLYCKESKYFFFFNLFL